VLIVFAGRPGTGKTTLARLVAVSRGAAVFRVDALETAMWAAGIERDQPTGLAAYLVARAGADACLRAGADVVIDACNPVEPARQGWRSLAAETGHELRVIEVTCSDTRKHERRIRDRQSDIDGLPMPTWDEVNEREYEPWHEPHLVIDNIGDDPASHLATIAAYLAAAPPR
jgi:predicted kinase